jgi:spore maturation protein CgeB
MSERVLLVGSFSGWQGNLESSYQRAFEAIGCECTAFDMQAAIAQQCRFGKMGRAFNTLVRVELWIRKANRELVLKCQEFRPTLIVVFGNCGVFAGSLAYAASLGASRTTLVWPDTLVNLSRDVIQSLPVYDLIASYSSTALDSFRKLGARSVAWVPLAADLTLHGPLPTDATAPQSFACDISFVGNWRPEREAALLSIASGNNLVIKVWGGKEWANPARSNPIVKKMWQGAVLPSAEFPKVVSASRLCLNVIDDTNFPAANMRFFEIFAAGGLQLSSPCPELEEQFRHGEHLFYYRTVDELPELVTKIMANGTENERVRVNAHQRVKASDTYQHRAQRILNILNAAQLVG